MSETEPSKVLNRTLVAGGLALVLFTGAAAVPVLTSQPADAQQIVIAPPSGAPMSFADLIERVRPAVVSIQVRQRPENAAGPAPDGVPPGSEDFFRGRPGRPTPGPTSLGSGFFVDASGVIVTNHHVIDGAEEITVTTSDGRQLPAEIIGSDELTDIAVLRTTERGHFPYVSFDREHDVRVGDWVVAVGNPFGLDGTATAGIVSAIGRRDAGSSAYVDYMQIDAPINRGNSGGPTFDLNGRVIGVNSAIFSPTGGNVGIGFAIPSETAARIVDQLTTSGRVARGWLGVSIQTQLDDDLAHSLGLPDTHGALVSSVTPDSPAAKAGVQSGDVILTFNGNAIEDSRDLTRRVGATAVGSNVRVEVLRGGQHRTLTVNLAERPSEQVLASATNPGTDQSGPGAATPAPAAQTQEALGAALRELNASDRSRLSLESNVGGLVIASVDPSSVLAEKGVSPGDVILQAGGQAVRNLQQLTSAVSAAQRAHRPLLLQVATRGGQRRYLAVEVGEG